MTRDQAHFARAEGKSCHGGTAQANFSGTSPQRHEENRLMLQPHARLCDRLRYVEFNPHLYLTPRLRLMLVSKRRRLLPAKKGRTAPQQCIKPSWATIGQTGQYTGVCRY